MNAAPIAYPRRWWLAVATVALVQFALILLLAEHGPVRVRTTEREPRVALAGDLDVELAALTAPTLHAWGGAAGFSAAAWHPAAAPVLRPPRYTEPPRFLALTPADLTGIEALLASETRAPSPPQPARNPPAPTVTPDVLATTSLPSNSTCEVTGELATRWRVTALRLPSQPCADVLGETVLQLRVDAAGRVQACTFLTRCGLPAADALALQLSRQFRFTPLPGAPTLAPGAALPVATGEVIFRWHTIPPPAAAPGA